MKKVVNGFKGEAARKNTLFWVLENQPPAMTWWLALSSLSICSIYLILFTRF